MFVKSLIFHNDKSKFFPRMIRNAFTDSDISEFTLFFVDEDYEFGINLEVKSEILETERSEITRFELKPQIVYEQAVYRKKGEEEFIFLYTRDQKGNISSSFFDAYNIKLPQLAVSKTVLNKIYEDYADNEQNEYEFMNVIRRLANSIKNTIKLY